MEDLKKKSKAIEHTCLEGALYLYPGGAPKTSVFNKLVLTVSAEKSLHMKLSLSSGSNSAVTQLKLISAGGTIKFVLSCNSVKTK